MMNVVFALLAKGDFSDIVEGVNPTNFSLAPFACSRSPIFFQKNSVIDLWLTMFKISRTIRETTSFYRQLTYFHFLCFYMKCCRPPLL